MRTSQLNVGTSTDVSLKIMETDLSCLTASIRAPSGNEETCLLKRLPNRHIGEKKAELWMAWKKDLQVCLTNTGLISVTSLPVCRHLIHTERSGRTRGQREEKQQTCDQQSLQDHGGTVGDWRRQ